MQRSCCRAVVAHLTGLVEKFKTARTIIAAHINLVRDVLSVVYSIQTCRAQHHLGVRLAWVLSMWESLNLRCNVLVEWRLHADLLNLLCRWSCLLVFTCNKIFAPQSIKAESCLCLSLHCFTCHWFLLAQNWRFALFWPGRATRFPGIDLCQIIASSIAVVLGSQHHYWSLGRWSRGNKHAAWLIVHIGTALRNMDLVRLASCCLWHSVLVSRLCSHTCMLHDLGGGEFWGQISQLLLRHHGFLNERLLMWVNSRHRRDVSDGFYLT